MFNIRELFDVENDQIVINQHILLIPKLKAIKLFYTNPIPAFSFLRYRYDLKGPYSDFPEDEKEDILLKDFPGEYTLEDECMIQAIEWLDSLLTPTQRYYLDTKVLMEKIGRFGRMSPVTDGRDGNISALQSQIKGAGKTILEFKQLEKVVEQEIEEMSKAKTRGGAEQGYDESN